MEFDPNFLSRIQFAFTISFHIIFPSFTIGLASWLAVVEALWLKTGNSVYQEIYKLWIKIFAVTFGMGVVSGVVMSYQFGTNWSGFSDKAGNVLGPLLGFEVLTAFFLESSFLGIMLFGWNRVSKRMHFFSTLIVAMILTGVIALCLYLQNKLFNTRWFQYWALCMLPAGFIAVLAGWFVTEIGRQPFVVYNVIRTSEASSPVLGQYIFISLIAFVVVYTFVFGAGSYYIIQLIKKGPTENKDKEIYGLHSLTNPLVHEEV